MNYKYLSVFMLLYICGIVYYSLSLPSCIIFALFIALFICIMRAKTVHSIVVVSIFTLCFASGYMQTYVKNNEYEFFYKTFCGRYAVVFGTVDDVPKTVETSFGQKNISYTVKLSNVKADDKFYKTDKKIIVYAPEGALVDIGDKVMLKGFLKSPDENANPNGFNYRQYLKTVSTAASLTFDDGVVTGKDTSVFYEIKKLRHKLLQKITEYMPEDKDVLVRALILGDKSNLDRDVQKMFSGSGVSHALALSGMHLSVLTAFVMHFISKTQMRLRVRAVICAVAVIVYIPIAGFFPSLVRAGIMTLFALASTLFKQKYDVTTSIVFAAAVILMDNPFVINSASFQMSFLATIGIIYFTLPACKLLRQKFKLNRFTGFVSMTAISSAFATLLTLPVVAKSFSSISLYTVLGNLIIVPLIEILFSGGIVMLALGAVFTPAAKVAGMVLAVLTDIIIFISDKISSLRGAFFVIKAPGFLEYLLYASVIFLVYCLLAKPKLKKPALIIAIAITLMCTVNEVYQSTVFRVDFVNVGQGDCALVQIPFGKNILIDCGPEGYGEAAAYIKSKGIRTLDTVYLSHLDSDHSGGLDEMLSAVRIKKVVLSHTNAQNEENFEILGRIIKAGTNIEFADNTYSEKTGICEIEGLWPGYTAGSDDNNNSLVLKLNCRGKTFLFTGDIDAETESAVLKSGENIKTDVLKVSHHGSKTSTSEQFIEKAAPKHAVISVAKNNSYGHPDSGVISRLEDGNCTVFRTDKNGYVHFSVDMFGNYKIKVKTLY